MTHPKFQRGWIVYEVPSHPGETDSGTHFRILAVYKDLNGYWYAAEVTKGSNVGDEVAIDEGYEIFWPKGK